MNFSPFLKHCLNRVLSIFNRPSLPCRDARSGSGRKSPSSASRWRPGHPDPSVAPPWDSPPVVRLKTCKNSSINARTSQIHTHWKTQVWQINSIISASVLFIPRLLFQGKDDGEEWDGNLRKGICDRIVNGSNSKLLYIQYIYWQKHCFALLDRLVLHSGNFQCFGGYNSFLMLKNKVLSACILVCTSSYLKLQHLPFKRKYRRHGIKLHWASLKLFAFT